MPRKYNATVDYLAEQLSRKTGTDFEVLRGRPMVKDSWMSAPEPGPMRYGLRATRREKAGASTDTVSYTFQASRPMPLNELTRWLASICDMIDMGFIPVDIYRSGPATRSREKGLDK